MEDTRGRPWLFQAMASINTQMVVMRNLSPPKLGTHIDHFQGMREKCMRVSHLSPLNGPHRSPISDTQWTVHVC